MKPVSLDRFHASLQDNPAGDIPRNNGASTLRGILFDCAIWFSAPAIFLYFYISLCGAPTSTILPHLRYVGVSLLTLLWLRAVLAWSIPGKKLLRPFTTLLTSSAILLLLFYYLLVAIGLRSWYRVISWELVSGYLPQLGELAATLEISLPMVGLALALVWLAALACVWFYLKKFDWVAPAVQASPARMLTIYLVAGFLLIALQAFSFLTWPDTRRFEPFALTMFPEEAASQLNTAESDKLRAAIDRGEDQQRASYKANPDAKKRNVILIVVDALRADHMGLYGYERDTTPYLSRLAQGGNVQIQRGLRAACAETTCGMISLLSSKFVPQFSERPFTLHEVLRRHGYAIHVVLGGDHTNFYGMTKIYGDVDSFFDGSMAKGMYPNDDRFVTEKAEALPAWDARPILLQFHLMSAHTLGKRNAGSGHYAPSKNYVGNANAYTPEPGTLSPLTQNHYDNGVVQADYTLEKILTSLQHKGYLSDALVIITADHGEGLGEHGLHSHANGVQEVLLRIPFIMMSYGYRMPALPGGETNASQVDIAPTILAELDIPAPASWAGSALQKGRSRDFSFFQQGHWQGLVDHRDPQHVWKYWTNDRNHAEYAFDLGADPREAHNLIDSAHPDLKIAWRRALLQSLH